MTLLLSSLGLLCQVNGFTLLVFCYLLYILLGGMVFKAVEKPVEERLRAEVEEFHRSFLLENPCVGESRLGELLDRALSAHQRDIAVWGFPHNHAVLIHALFLSVVVVALLFLLPALLVSAVEPDWSYLDALFFCFVTMSTVGQGESSLGRGFKDTVLQVPQVRKVIRLLSGPHYAELDGVHLSELSEETCEEELQYSQSICTISSTPLDLQTVTPDTT